MTDFWAQLAGGAITTSIGGLVGFLSAFSIHRKQLSNQKDNLKQDRLISCFSSLHKVHFRLAVNDFPDRKLTKDDYEIVDFALTILVIDHEDLWESYGNKMSKALNRAYQNFETKQEREKAFRKFDAVLVNIMNEIQTRLRDFSA